ncbi:MULTISPECIES: hypothetical protein [Flagellimonas]|uniref:Uncharacterized protein n=2 Tax=Flagellimonas TaxID=444459 RepID=A0A3A1NFV4_9FLAO|nr:MULTISPECIES: hypothetical protein [Allomuricauda]NDV45021.1 hypothetical protein [Allomuricauda sediminis]RIV42393.1 hypothetical protein D2V05_16455 [Allomuricauda maritima]TXJ91422.1 hypothetical protein FQ017_16315 [Allomuricauda maritima]|tara:strand:+ start:429 stop:782 length:354 start_codon:yes stop_codon:yes gene_type:complete
MKNNKVNIHLLGDAGTVTGSKYMMESTKKEIPIECGHHYNGILLASNFLGLKVNDKPLVFWGDICRTEEPFPYSPQKPIKDTYGWEAEVPQPYDIKWLELKPPIRIVYKVKERISIN